MRDELTRAMTGLRIAGQPAPYYIAYTIDDVAGRQMQATLGALVGDGRRRSRTVRVDVRVGDYARDSSRFVSFDRDPGVSSMYAMGVVEAPLDDDVAVLRRQLWLVTDAAYRKALATFAKKQAALQNQASARSRARLVDARRRGRRACRPSRRTRRPMRGSSTCARCPPRWPGPS